MLYPLAIGATCILTSIVGTFFVKLGKNRSIMGALYKGFFVTGALSLILLWPLTNSLIGMETIIQTSFIQFTGMDMFLCGVSGLAVTTLIIVILTSSSNSVPKIRLGFVGGGKIIPSIFRKPNLL